MKSLCMVLVVALATLITTACPPPTIQQTAYQTVVGAKAFLTSVKTAHPECAVAATATSTLCVDLAKATSAKDLLIDAVEDYCSSPTFDTGGGVCTPPAAGTPALTTATNALNAAIASYAQTAADLKGVM
jgi:hypothetical protein